MSEGDAGQEQPTADAAEAAESLQQGHPEPVHYHLELSPAQLKITHTALKSLLDDFGHDQHEVVRVINEVLAKLPDEHSIRAISLDQELGRGAG